MGNGNLGAERFTRVSATAQRYINNIMAQKDYQEADRQSRIAKYSGKYSKSQEISKDNDSRQYSRRVYMGLSNG